MAVRIRLKRMGRRHRPFFRVCAMDSRSPRDGRVIEELGYYDPMVAETDARAVLQGERIDYWLGVGAQPTEKVSVLIKKYGKDGTHLDAQAAALERLAQSRPTAPPPMVVKAKAPEEPAAEAAADESSAGESAEKPADEAAVTEESATEESATEESTSEGSADAETSDSEKPDSEGSES